MLVTDRVARLASVDELIASLLSLLDVGHINCPDTVGCGFGVDEGPGDGLSGGVKINCLVKLVSVKTEVDRRACSGTFGILAAVWDPGVNAVVITHTLPTCGNIHKRPK